MEYKDFYNGAEKLRERLFDENGNERQDVRVQLNEFVMTAQAEAFACHPEVVELWNAQKKLQKAGRVMAAYIGSIANKVLECEIKDRCTMSFIPVSDDTIGGVFFSISLGSDQITGSKIQQLVSEIGEPCSEHYWIKHRKSPDGNVELVLEFSGTCTNKLAPYYIDERWNLNDQNETVYLMSDESRSKLRNSLYNIPEDTVVENIDLPVMFGDTPCIEATVNGVPRSDMLSKYDYDHICFLCREFPADEEIHKFLVYLICKYLLKKKCSWVNDGIPLCYVNKENEEKICVREYYALPASQRVKYILYDRRWDKDFGYENFLENGKLNLVKWLESFRDNGSLSFILFSKRGAEYSRTIKEVIESREKEQRKRSLRR